MTQNMFSSEVELGKFLGSIDLIPYAFSAISETFPVYQLHTSRSGIQVLAFNCSSDYTTRFLNGEFGLISSQNLQVNVFISTKVNPKFSINKAAVELFDQHIFNKLSEIENQLVDGSLVVTGQGLGGYLAVVFTLWKLHAIDVEESNASKYTKRPICITFGSPLVGDEAFQQAISERPQWKSRFLNVVAEKDRVASFFSSSSPYRPSGTTLFCTESGGHTAFEDQEAVLAVLDVMASSNAGNLETTYNYKNVLGSIRKKVLYRGASELGNFNLNPFRAGITLQFREVGVLDDIPNDLIGKLEDKQTKRIKRKKSSYEPTKKLNDMKISLTYMEWYMKTGKSKGAGYYDCYRNEKRTREEIESQSTIVIHKDRLNQYWKKEVTEKDQMPQKEGAKLRKRWLYGGNNYRRILEPLDIAEYYRKGKKDYVENRSRHYTLLEKWLNEDKSLNPSDGKRKAASLTEDSCFWAYVEEALISLRDLQKGGSTPDTQKVLEQKLIEFEKKLMGEIKDFSVSPDIFLEGSSLMTWWREYKVHKGSSYASEFARYMNTKSYESYQ